MPLSEGQNVQLLEQIVADQRQLLMDVFNTTDVTTIPQVWTLCKYRTHIPAHPCMVLVANVRPVDKEVEGYYEDGMRVPDDVILLWSDDKCVSHGFQPTES